jgi:alpha-D-xyloside xylohydrolase
VDFTNPAACEWYSGKLIKLLETGVDCFKTDFGERIPAQDVRYYDGSDPEKMHNYYTYIYNKTVFETIKAKQKDAIVFARSATTGCQKFPVHWGGDSTANYQSMAETLRGGLSLGMGGFGFWSHDIGGFESTATPDLYKRWAAFGLLSSHSRLHGSSSYRVPWLFDEESVDVVRNFTKLKCSLMPYIYAAANEAAETGVPLMRAMVVEFENDPACAHLDQQYMFGESLLVAPIFNDRSEATYYLPNGQWINFFTGETVNGGSFRCEKYDYMSLPLFIRENSIVAIGSHDNRPDYEYADGVELHISSLCEGVMANTVVFDSNSKKELEVSALLENGSITITACGEGKPWTALLMGVRSAISVSGATAKTQDGSLLLTPDKYTGTVHVQL